jgi:hypothetical protein
MLCSLHGKLIGKQVTIIGIASFFVALLDLEFTASCLLGRYSTTWATLPVFFCVVYFWGRVSHTVCPGFPQTVILLISASWVARIWGWAISAQLINFFLRLVSNHDPPNLHLLSSCDYRHLPSNPAHNLAS